MKKRARINKSLDEQSVLAILAVARKIDLKLRAFLKQADDAALADLPTLNTICEIYVQLVARLCPRDKARAAQILGIGRNTLYRHQTRFRCAEGSLSQAPNASFHGPQNVGQAHAPLRDAYS